MGVTDEEQAEFRAGVTPEMADPRRVYLDRDAGNGGFLLRVVANRLVNADLADMTRAIRTLYALTATQRQAEICSARIFNMMLDFLKLGSGHALQHPSVVRTIAEIEFWLTRNIRAAASAWSETAEGKAWLSEQDGTYREWNFGPQHWYGAVQLTDMNGLPFHAHRPRRVRGPHRHA